MRSTPLAVAILLSACNSLQPPPPVSGCGPASCSGCCDRDGVCQLGEATSACGTTGAQCTPCGMGLSCRGGACTSTGGTGGGTSGTGGGSGTGSGTAGQELVSGTRLRAIYHLGEDGSKAATTPTIFWDTALSTYCAPDLRTGVCLPLRVVGPYAEGYYFRDSACTDPNVGTLSDETDSFFVDAGLPQGQAYFFADDGGIFTATAGSAWSKQNPTAPCLPANPMPSPWYVPAAPVAASGFAKMPLRRE